MNQVATQIRERRVRRNSNTADIQEKIQAAILCLEAIQPTIPNIGLQSYVNLTLATLKDSSVKPVKMPDCSELNRLREENEHMKMVLKLKGK